MLTGQIDLTAAQEGVAIANTTDIASFTDDNLTDTASSFTALIDWGDGTTTSGTVTGSNGNFTVEGGHTYSDEGFPLATVTITRTADNTQITPSATIPVADADDLTGHSAPTISGNPNQALTNVVVATFTDTFTGNTPGDFTNSIDWGDGTTSTGVISGTGGSFTVTGSHTYATAGQFTITTFMNDDAPEAAFGFATTTAAIGFGGNEAPLEVTEGSPLTTTVATFNDNTPGLNAGDYIATIEWGDGTTTAGTITGSNGSFTVSGTHTYADEGDLTSITHVTRTTDSAQISMSGPVAVDEGDDISASGATINGNLALSNVTVATFSDTLTTNVASDFVATIDWGDGTTSAGTISGSNGSFTVSGSHTYAQGGQYTVDTLVVDDAPGTAADEVQSSASVGLFNGVGANFTEPERTAVNSPNIANFADGNTADTAAAFTATIDWGDGTTSPGTVIGSNGSFLVVGPVSGHAYADEGLFTTTTIVTHTADNSTLTITGTATANEADNLVVTAHNFTAQPGVALNNIVVADLNNIGLPGASPGDLLATIDWGDGTTSAGTISGANDHFTISGTHTYTSGGSFNVATTAVDDGSGTANATGVGVATINLAGQMALTNATEGTALASNTPVATFGDSNGGDTPASFTATIDWGDGVTSAGTVSGGAGTFTVSGGHTYADEGNDAAKVIVSHTADGATSTVSGSVSVAEADVLTGHPVSFTAHAHQAFSGTVATFDDTFTANVPGDFVATIDWGDGTTTTGTVSGGSGSFTVSGAHTYISPGQDTVTVLLADDAPGTATATASSVVNVAARSAKNDFNGDRTSDLLFQETGGSDGGGHLTGTPQIWLMNNTSVTAQVTLPNPGATWSIVGTGDFNNDGDDDILFNDAATGNVQIWEMNGTSVASMIPLPFPGANWVPLGIGDFNGDGTADILWRNSVSGEVDTWFINNGHMVGGTGAGFAGSQWQMVGLGDFNGDGTTDVLWRNKNTGAVESWMIHNGLLVGGGGVGTASSAWVPAGTGDFNGDGTTDVLWRNTNTGEVDDWLMTNGHISGGTAFGFAPAGTTVVGTGDYNADGKADILLQAADGTPTIWTTNGTAVTATTSFATPGPNWHAKTG